MRLPVADRSSPSSAPATRASPAAARPGRDSAGVHIVDNPARDTPLPWSLTEVFRLGGQDSGAEPFTEAGRWTAGTDTLGHLFVMDRQTGRVEVFDSTGRQVRALGRKGGGPGELQYPGLLVVDPDGVVTVVDYGKNALVRFAADGSVLPQLSLSAGFPNGGILISNDTTVMVAQQFEDRLTTSRLKIITPVDTTVLDSLTVTTRGPVMYKCVGLNLPPVLSPQILWTSHAGEIAVTGQTRYTVDFYRGDRLVRSVRRAARPRGGDRGACGPALPRGHEGAVRRWGRMRDQRAANWSRSRASRNTSRSSAISRSRPKARSGWNGSPSRAIRRRPTCSDPTAAISALSPATPCRSASWGPTWWLSLSRTRTPAPAWWWCIG